MIKIQQLKLPIAHTQEELVRKIAKSLRMAPLDVKEFRIVKKSVDARNKDNIMFIYTIELSMKEEAAVLHRAKNVNVTTVNEKKYQFPKSGDMVLSHRPVIIGSGPAGLFCGLLLAQNGYRPLILERGEDVDARVSKVSKFWLDGTLDSNSNVQFGEGGAGTFSDGKLNTLLKDPFGRNQKVLELFVDAGADASILSYYKPHIGTDVLRGVVKQMREQIMELGGEIRFLHQVTDFVVEKGALKGLLINHKTKIDTDMVVLAIGHSARDTFETLLGAGADMQQKSFAVGLRIQHPQAVINLGQYGRESVEKLGAADYKLTKTTNNGRGVYSFCMCPGGYVVNASSEQNLLAVNGMSDHARDGINANSALIVSVNPEDFPFDGPLAGLEFQRELEKKAFLMGNGNIPTQLWGDFVKNCESRLLGEVGPEFRGAYALTNLRELLPDDLSFSLIEAMESFQRTIKDFGRYDALLAGVESRTSSPVRILRDDAFESNLKGLLPCGEGAGYAGGITSAAMDGIKVAEEIARRYKPMN